LLACPAALASGGPVPPLCAGIHAGLARSFLTDAGKSADRRLSRGFRSWQASWAGVAGSRAVRPAVAPRAAPRGAWSPSEGRVLGRAGRAERRKAMDRRGRARQRASWGPPARAFPCAASQAGQCALWLARATAWARPANPRRIRLSRAMSISPASARSRRRCPPPTGLPSGSGCTNASPSCRTGSIRRRRARFAATLTPRFQWSRRRGARLPICRRAARTCTAIDRAGRVEPLDAGAVPERGAWPRWRRAACGVRRPVKAPGRALPASRPGLHRDQTYTAIKGLAASSRCRPGLRRLAAMATGGLRCPPAHQGAQPRSAGEPPGPAPRLMPWPRRGARCRRGVRRAAHGRGRRPAVAPPARRGARPRSAGEPAGPAPRSTPRPRRGRGARRRLGIGPAGLPGSIRHGESRGARGGRPDAGGRQAAASPPGSRRRGPAALRRPS